MRTSRDQQSLSYPLRLPDDIQADALRLLDVSREVINLTVTALWDRLDEFATRTNSYAYKQVEERIASTRSSRSSSMALRGRAGRAYSSRAG